MTALRDQILQRGLATPLIVAACAALILFPGIGRPSLLDRDETTYAEAAREMKEAGSWFQPRLNGREFHQKPFLPIALIRVGYECFGVGEAGARFPSAVFGVATSVLTAAIARRLFGRLIALRAGMVLGSSLLFLLVCRSAMTDSVFLFFFTACLYAFFRDSAGEPRSRVSLAILYSSSALATLCKGPVGLVLPLGIVYSIAWREEGIGGIRRLRPLFGAAVVTGLATPWYVAFENLTGGGFLRDFFGRENIGRFLSPMGGHRGPFWIYLPALAVTFLPWSVFVPGSVSAIGDRRIRWSLGIWILVPFLFFSAAATKLPHYLLPIFPPLAILVAAGWDTWEGAAFSRRVATLSSLLILTAAFPISLVVARSRWPAWFPWTAIVAAAILPVGAVAALLAGRRSIVVFASLFSSSAIFGWLLCAWALPALNAVRVVPPIGRLLGESRDAPVYSYRFLEPGLLFYSRRTIEKFERPEEIAAALSKTPSALIVAREEDRAELNRAIPLRLVGVRRGVSEDSGPLDLVILESEKKVGK